MDGQAVGVVALVGAAVAYLVWKLAFSGRPRRPRGPDVPVDALVRKKRDGGGCH